MDDIIEALEAYVNHGVEPGGFLMAVLENDLMKACARADGQNKGRFFDIVQQVYHRVPSRAWGSLERVAAWIEHCEAKHA